MFCPHCGKEQDELPGKGVSPATYADFSQGSSQVGKTCPFCQSVIKPGAPIIVCPSCNIPHHKECWIENGNKCTTFGCKGTNRDLSDSQPQPLPNRVSQTPIPAVLQPTSPGSIQPDGGVKWSSWIIGILAVLIVGFFALSNEKPAQRPTNRSTLIKTSTKLTMASGSVYVGEVRNGMPEGKGEMNYTQGGKYVGIWSKGKRHGQGKMTWVTGNWYEGEWRDDQMSGMGVIKNFAYEDGMKIDYKGDFLNGKFHGNGIAYVYKPNGNEAYRYEGRFIEGRMNDDKGTINFANGDKYVGGIRNDQLNGRGTFFWANGKRRTGNWANDRPTE